MRDRFGIFGAIIRIRKLSLLLVMTLRMPNKEYLHDFNHLSRYAPEFVSTDAKKIASFKRGLGPKLLKTMGHTKSVTFNKFVSDALTQENYNVVYTTTKTRKRAFEAEASQSKALVAAKPQYHALTPNMRYRQFWGQLWK